MSPLTFNGVPIGTEQKFRYARSAFAAAARELEKPEVGGVRIRKLNAPKGTFKRRKAHR